MILSLSKAERAELVLITLVVGTVFFLGSSFPTSVSVGGLVLFAFATLLTQSLVRDLYYLFAARKKKKKPEANKPAVRCMCAESTVGFIGVILGALLLLAGIGSEVSVGRISWTLVVSATLIGCFLIKDFVIETGPLRLRRDPDHINILVKWKK